MPASQHVRLRFGLVALLLVNCVSYVIQPVFATTEISSRQRKDNIHRWLYAIYSKRDDYEQQVTQLNELVKLNPQSAIFPHLLGIAEMKQGHFRQAIAHFKHAVQVDPNFSSSYTLEGECYTRLVESEKAAEEYKECPSGAPEHHSSVGDFEPHSGEFGHS